MATAVERLINLDATKTKSIVIIGDILTDVYIQGEMASCQDNCTMFKEQSRIVTPGGAANAANSLFHWQAKVKLFGAKYFGTKTRYISNGRIVFRHDEDIVATNFASRHLQALAAVDNADAVLLCDYDKGFLTESFIRDVIKRANLCVADVKREPKLFVGAILKCNKLYVEKYSDFLGGKIGIITDGANLPIELITSERLGMPKSTIECINHVGAGDCFSAHLTLGLAHGLTLEEAAIVAHSASRVYVRYQHNKAPHLSEVICDE